MKTTSPRLINIDLIDYNEGQIDGLLPNPREIDIDNFDRLKKQIQQYPEMLQYRALMVYPYNDGRFIAIGGNMRLRALKELRIEQTPCFIIPEYTSAEELNAYQILDNVPFGRWDISKLTEHWNTTELVDFAVNVPVPEDSLNLGEFFEDGDDDTKVKIIVVLPQDKQHLKDQIKEDIKNKLINNSYLGIKVK